MRLFHVALLAAVSLATAGVVTQEKPNLSGKWIFDHDETPPEAKAYSLPSGGRGRVPDSVLANGNFGPAFTLTQDANTLKLDRARTDGTVNTTTYVLDGSEVQHRNPDVNGQPGPVSTSRSSWKDATLVITTFQEGQSAKIGRGGQIMEKSTYQSENKRTLSLTPDGKLVSESTSRVSLTGEWTPATRSIYKKS